MTRQSAIARVSVAMTAALAIACGSPSGARATDAYPCGAQTTSFAWSSSTENPYGSAVQPCPLAAALPPNGWVPVYAHPVPNPAGAQPPPPVGWLHGTYGEYFVCQQQTSDVYYHPTRGWRNIWWAYTLSDDGHFGWVPEVFFEGGNDDEADAGLRDCQPGQPAPAAPVDPCNPQPETSGLSMTAEIAAMRARAVGRPQTTIAYGARVRMSGVLTGPTGAPAANTTICIASRDLVYGAGRHSFAITRTDAHGRFSWTWRAGPSREFSFVARDGLGATSANVTVHVRPSISLRGSRSSLRNGQVLVLRGRLNSQPQLADVLVDLQALRSPGHWQTFGTASATPGGRFSFSYPFTRSATPNHRWLHYALRAFVPAQVVYPFTAGASPVVHVRVSG